PRTRASRPPMPRWPRLGSWSTVISTSLRLRPRRANAWRMASSIDLPEASTLSMDHRPPFGRPLLGWGRAGEPLAEPGEPLRGPAVDGREVVELVAGRRPPVGADGRAGSDLATWVDVV